jgi:Uma2 family endonuclease
MSEMQKYTPSFDKRYNYGDYLAWPDEIRYELIDGKAYALASPSREHARIVGRLHLLLGNFLAGKPCEAAFGLDVRLEATDEADRSDGTVVQPDLMVVCDEKKMGKNAVIGAPDFIIEVLSPSNRENDLYVKYLKYELSGVREYWIVDPQLEQVFVHILKDGKYSTSSHDSSTELPVSALPGLVINLESVF